MEKYQIPVYIVRVSLAKPLGFKAPSQVVTPLMLCSGASYRFVFIYIGLGCNIEVENGSPIALRVSRQAWASLSPGQASH